MLSFINITVATPVSMAKRVLIFLLCVFAFWTASRAHASESISIEGFWKGEKRTLVSVRKVVESYEPDVIQESYHRMEDKTDVDIRKPWFL